MRTTVLLLVFLASLGVVFGQTQTYVQHETDAGFSGMSCTGNQMGIARDTGKVYCCTSEVFTLCGHTKLSGGIAGEVVFLDANKQFSYDANLTWDSANYTLSAYGVDTNSRLGIPIDINQASTTYADYIYYKGAR